MDAVLKSLQLCASAPTDFRPFTIPSQVGRGQEGSTLSWGGAIFFKGVD